MTQENDFGTQESNVFEDPSFKPDKRQASDNDKEEWAVSGGAACLIVGGTTYSRNTEGIRVDGNFSWINV